MALLKKVLLRIFTWWNGQTTGTWLYTKRFGILVGTDSQGNIYYKDNQQGTAQRRWVIYNGESEASRIPPEWHLWMHKMVDTPPTEMTLTTKSWEKPHHENLTAQNTGYAPAASLLRKDNLVARKTTDAYEAWKPE